MSNWFVFPVIVLSSFLLTELIRRYTLKNNLLDTPNDRSSHSIPTPRGGGLSFVIIFLVAVIFTDDLSTEIVFAIIGSGIIISSIGFWDDHEHIAAKWRLLAHFIAAFWVFYWLGGIPEFQFLSYSIELGWLGIALIVFLLVWLLNLFNFMDGIDGIAASEAIFISSGGALFSWLYGLESLVFISLLLTASTTGFLLLNWPPAKIFMGDVGSGFLGLMLGVIAYVNILETELVWIWVILFGVFFVDSGVTLIRRIFNNERWYEAHCSHAYQHAAKKWGHKFVTISVIVINVFWLLPLAYTTYLYPKIALLVTLIAYIPLILATIILKAGISDNHKISVN